jgi:hypothetical protein
MKQHPLSAALPTRSQEELTSIENCEGLIALAENELRALTATAWFKSKNVAQRALLIACLCEWAAQGSNQHVRRSDPRSPRAAARAAAEVISKAAHA